MHDCNNRMKKNSLAKNYIYNVSYQILVLILPLITTPYVVRVLGPDGTGMYSFTNSVSQYYILFGCIGLNLYGQREIAFHQNDKRKRSIIFFELLSVRICTMLFSIAIFCLTVLQSEKYALLYKIELLELVASIFDITWFFQGMEEFRLIVIRNSIVKIISVVLIFLLVTTVDDTATYTAILVVTVLISNIFMWIYLPKYIQKVTRVELNPIKHILPMILLFIPQIATSVYNVLDKTMIGIITGSDAEVSYYEQAQKITKMTLSLPAAVGTVMLPRIANLYGNGDDEEIKKYIYLSMRFVCMITFPLCFGMIGIARDFVPWFYGYGFDKVYDNFLVISPIIIFVGISNVLGVQYLLPTNRQNDYTKSVMVGTIFNFIFNLFLIPSLMSVGAAIGSVIAEGGVTITQLFILRKLFSIKYFISIIYKYAIGAFVMLIPIILYSNYLGEKSVQDTFVEIIIGIIIYTLYLLIVRDELIKKQVNDIIKLCKGK